MKNLFKKITIPVAALCCVGFVGCKDDDHKMNYNINSGDERYSPADGFEVDLGTRVSTTFEWAPSTAEDGRYVLYTVLLDKENGDFSKPIASIPSQAGGSKNYLTLTAKELNKIARASGLDKVETGNFKWTVKASKGLLGTTYPESSKIVITTMNSMNPLPVSVTLEGAATEDQEEGIKMVLSQGIDGVAGEEGAFECFTQLGAGAFTIVDDLGRYYRLDANGAISDHTSAVDNTAPAGAGIYWLRLEFDGMIWSYEKVTQVVLYAAAWADGGMHTKRTPMTYAGKGVWELLNYDNANSNNTAKDSRHRFDMTLGDGSTLYLGHSAGSGPQSYTMENMKVHLFTSSKVGNADWDRTYKLLDSDCGRPFDCYLYMNGDNAAGSWFHEKIFK